MLKAVRLACAAAAFALFAACNSDPNSGVATLAATATPRQIDAHGGSSMIGVEAHDAKGNPGTGQVTLVASAGRFADGNKTTSLTLANGIASIGYSCDVNLDPLCAGQVHIDATWGRLAYSLPILVGDGSGGNPDGGGPDGGPVSVGFLNLTASKNPIFFNVGDSSNITAQLSADAGVSLGGQTINFSTNLGGFVLPDGGSNSTLDATTGSDGKAMVVFHDTGSAGTALLQAAHAPSGSLAQMNLPILNIQAVSWVSTRCGGVACTIMGIRGSGFNEQATVTFRVVDSTNTPAPGVRVSFSLTNPPLGTTVTPSGVTDSTGTVNTNISVGRVIGVFTVQATVIPNQVQINSPPIGLRGAKPSNQGMVLDCSPVNIAAYVAPQPPADLPSTCTVTLVDRFGNAVGTGAAVNFKSEAGVVPSTINTVAFNPSAPDPAEGTGRFTFRSGGPFDTLLDVPPLGPLPSQWPFPRTQEPSVIAGSLTRNPRDGLVTVIAYTRGEEYFQDNNDNGVWDPGELFIDQGEPFVDSNDNGVWDSGELYFDANGNGHYDGPNGVYDADTYVWTETRILYSGRPVADSAYTYIVPTPYAGPCPAGVPRGGVAFANVHFGDLNLNIPQSAGTAFAVATQPAPGSATIGGGLLDGYGFGMARRLIDSTSFQACDTHSSLICIWRVLFGDWGAGYVGQVTINGQSPTAPPGCTDNVLLGVKSTVLSVDLTVYASGSIR